jgi:hypothetical protein
MKRKLVACFTIAAALGAYGATAVSAREGPDPKETCGIATYSVAAALVAKPIVILTQGVDYDCKTKPCDKIPIVMKSEGGACFGTMNFDRIVVPEDDRGAGKRIAWVLVDASGKAATNFEFDEKEGIKIRDDRKQDFSDRKRDSAQKYSYKNAHKEDCQPCKDRKDDECKKCRKDRRDKKDWSTACFLPVVWMPVQGKPSIACKIGDPLIWNQ